MKRLFCLLKDAMTPTLKAAYLSHYLYIRHHKKLEKELLNILRCAAAGRGGPRSGQGIIFLRI